MPDQSAYTSSSESPPTKSQQGDFITSVIVAAYEAVSFANVGCKSLARGAGNIVAYMLIVPSTGPRSNAVLIECHLTDRFRTWPGLVHADRWNGTDNPSDITWYLLVLESVSLNQMAIEKRDARA